MAETVDTDQEVRRLEQALEEALAERNRLWEELNRRKAQDRELAYQTQVAEDMASSLSWRLTTPLRLAMQIRRDPVKTLKAIARKVFGGSEGS
jgi:seryl-tRNA synthetase